MKRILVPTDFSDQAKYALDAAHRIALKTGAALVLIHVIEDATVTSVHYTGEVELPEMTDRLFMMRMIEKGKKKLEKLATSEAFSDIVVEQELRIGSPYHNIRDIVSEQEVDLVVMGTKGSSGVEEFLIGSNAEKVVRHAKCPVLTIHEELQNHSLETIVYATALDEDEIASFEVVKIFQAMYGAKINIVRINTPNNFQPDRVALKELEEFAEKLKVDNYELRIFNDNSEEEGIIYFAEQVKADLIAMATHGRTGLSHLLGGSIAEDVVNHTRRPVLTYSLKK
ncbi:universal stress protein [Fulvivirga sediminis]|uniref:Universal stress protein n=1 Tax=Fulvivirga sediminis TaxID=2803949 RepID=A0A937FCT8_9BACT|nr:universal stress protein [Fulvivirga sediminis]MBL3658068.1 universal stress protein [Fulvivirga sediminis]